MAALRLRPSSLLLSRPPSPLYGRTVTSRLMEVGNLCTPLSLSDSWWRKNDALIIITSFCLRLLLRPLFFCGFPLYDDTLWHVPLFKLFGLVCICPSFILGKWPLTLWIVRLPYTVFSPYGNLGCQISWTVRSHSSCLFNLIHIFHLLLSPCSILGNFSDLFSNLQVLCLICFWTV